MVQIHEVMFDHRGKPSHRASIAKRARRRFSPDDALLPPAQLTPLLTRRCCPLYYRQGIPTLVHLLMNQLLLLYPSINTLNNVWWCQNLRRKLVLEHQR